MKISNLGYPRIGRKREMKTALEHFWSSKSTTSELEAEAKRICVERWVRQFELGVDSIPLNDFSLYDQVLDQSVLLGGVPERFRSLGAVHDLEKYFGMARGLKSGNTFLRPLELTKWFNTNYHYLVPEIDATTPFAPNLQKIKKELDWSRAYPYRYHAVLIGPWTYLKLSRLTHISFTDAIQKLVPVYREILRELKKWSLTWVQMDEPSMTGDLLREDLKLLRRIYEELSGEGVPLMLTTYFQSPDPWLSEVSSFPVAGLHLDLVRGADSMSWLKTKTFPKDKLISLGVVSGRNIWAANLKDLHRDLQILGEYYATEKTILSPSCSLMHLPLDKRLETDWDPELSSWLSFADQRLEELQWLKKAALDPRGMQSQLEDRALLIRMKSSASRVNRNEIKQAVERIDESMKKRKLPFARRKKLQKARLKLPLLPTTTIGSFPQTAALRRARREHYDGKLDSEAYRTLIQNEIERVIRFQERVGLDVLVHGEAERSDMVEYFAAQMEGFAFSRHGWVQSYGSRCVRPPILFGDVKRKGPMTVECFQYAQSLTKKPVKAILTGPVTLLNWSFVREDQPREKTAYQIALALREEVRDLEQAGALIIQIDEAALREGLPIKRTHWNQYLKWAVEAFRLASCGVSDHVQIQMHLCYSAFIDVAEALGRMDVDVLLLECARNDANSQAALKKLNYPNDIGPGIYDVHADYVPTPTEFKTQIESALKIFPPERLWVSPDCGLKTRSYDEVEQALKGLVSAVQEIRIHKA